MGQTNQIELVGIYGSDKTHALSAWTSTSRDLTPEKEARIPALLKMLAGGSDGNEHGTPFEKSSIQFLVTGDIASHIHCLKHRIGVSINAESARYKELKDDKYYIPHDWPTQWQQELEFHCKQSLEAYHKCLLSLVQDHGMDRKRAKESARFFLPYANQIQWDILFNFRSFVHFIKLRMGGHAQLEIKEIATEMLRLVKEDGSFKYSLEAYGL